MEPSTSAFGDAFEHWVILEFVKLSKYAALDWELSYLQTKEGAEINLVITRPGQALLLVEIKSKTTVTAYDARILEKLGEDFEEVTEKWLLSQDPLPQTFGTTKAMHWLDAIKNLLKP